MTATPESSNVADPSVETPTLAGYIIVDRDGEPMTLSPGDAGECVELALTREAAARAVADYAVEGEHANRLPLVVKAAELRILAGDEARHTTRRRVVFDGYVSATVDGEVDVTDSPDRPGFVVLLSMKGAAGHQGMATEGGQVLNMMRARITVDLVPDHAPDIPHDHHADPTSHPGVLHAIGELRAAWSHATGSPTEGAKLVAALADLGESWYEDHDGRDEAQPAG